MERLGKERAVVGDQREEDEAAKKEGGGGDVGGAGGVGDGQGELSGDTVLGFVFIGVAVLTIVAGLIFYQWSSSELPVKEGAAFVRVDVNSADEATLSLLPGVGPAMAGRIIEDRAANGPFREVGDLERVKGIGPKLMERLRSHVVCGPEVPQSSGAGPAGRVAD
jgi:competence protein ComEA